ncbi:hypothetical protein G6321_00053615 [Bradyrhizobium barranii subsp. barranii]|uniref:Uncharacterized protein n=1 Tax=Bradyrhizobium barranii subsp. barranii TaxID=2823807 RepID=A0A7Z0QAE1_9BRAD|nr:hypothetical protein [Bradyrhizobium barranii]UGX94282.1 hypothetical protein G6321_00053615 [Bradyrhizobium barranii subsp. barranii]
MPGLVDHDERLRAERDPLRNAAMVEAGQPMASPIRMAARNASAIMWMDRPKAAQAGRRPSGPWFCRRRRRRRRGRC